MPSDNNSTQCELPPRSVSGPTPHLLEEMAQLLDAQLTQADFHRKFLERVVSATKAVGGAVWQRTADRPFQLACAHNWDGLGLEAVPEGPACHGQVLQVAAQRERPLWVPPHSVRKLVGDNEQAANLTEHGLLLAPVVLEKNVVGLVELWFEAGTEAAERRELARFLSEMAGIVAAFFHRNQLQSLLQQERLWTQLQAFSRQIHGSLDPTIVAQGVANEGRRLLECDQLAVAIRWTTTAEVTAVSGASSLERNSHVVQVLETLCTCVLHWGERLVYQGKPEEGLPPAVAHALDAYLAESNCTTLIVLPMEDCVLAAESHNPTLTGHQLLGRLESIASQAGPALANARQVARMPLNGLSRRLAVVRDWTNQRNLARLGLYALPVLLLMGVLTFVQIPLRMEAKGQLLPTQRQIIYAPLHGKVLELKVRHGDRVDKGQELLFIEDLETQLQIDQLTIKTSSAEQRIALLSEQIGKNSSNEDRNALTRERINQEYELRKAMAERDILLQGSRTPRKAPVFAPSGGKVVTFDMQEQLLGKAVKPGDPLLRVAAVKGPWEIELQIPERNLGPIREGLHGSAEGFLNVDLLLANQPNRTYKGRLYLDGLGGETVVKDTNVVLPARIRITDAELIAQLESLPVGLEVRTKVGCGPRAVGNVWFYEFWEFFYEHVMF